MDANEFLKKVTPAAHRSRLAPFWNDITKLRENNCTLDQVRDFLAANGVVISVAGLSNYIKRRDEKVRQKEDHPLRRSTDKKPPVGADTEMGSPAPNSAGDEHLPSPQSLDEVLDAKQREKKFDKYSSQNPLMKRKEK